MSLRKLSAGDGYTCLTRQVAAQDATHRGRERMTPYLAERGESPGVWLGSAATSEDGFPAVGQAVSETQMVALFGGLHPHADDIEARLIAAGRSVQKVRVAFKAVTRASLHRARLGDIRSHDIAPPRCRSGP